MTGGGMSKSAIELLLERADYLMRVFCGIDEIREEDWKYSDFDLYRKWQDDYADWLKQQRDAALRVREWVE